MPRGQKTCPACNEACGPRTLVCECGHDFQIGQREPGQASSVHQPAPIAVSPPEQLEARPYGGHTAICTPAGKCPVAWSGCLVDWVRAVQATAPEGSFYTDEALVYWLRQR